MTRPELVVVGTSLGGLNALTRLLETLPDRFRVPIVIVQHRAVSPDGGGLAELLQGHTRLTVFEAEDKMPLEAGSVYLAPADYHLMIESAGVLALSTDAPVRSARPSIDVLFQTASDAYRDALLGVLLTGASSDGAEGLASVKANGGRAIVEDPATAECRTMPAAALATTAVDYVLTLDKIGDHLVTLVEGYARMTQQVDILLVDDHEENLLALEAILVEPAYNLVRARSGRAALKEVLKCDFALILLDVAMPDLDGYETAELIRRRERSRQTPIIFLTANNRSDSHVFRGYSVGAVDYLFKPFSPDILRSKVAVFVELYQKREALKRQTQALLHAHEELEDRVRARTRELAETNHSLREEVDERKRIEAERLILLESEQSARANAEAVNRLKDEFLATLSHELRTPLNAILGWSHLLSSGKSDKAMVERAIGVIRNNALAQSQLIEDILDVSRIIGGKLRLKLARVQIGTVIEAALDSISPAVQAKAIVIQREIEDIDAIVGDQDRLQQVVWNLLSNAVKFTPREGRVVVRLQRRGAEVLLAVEDTGIGITPHFLPYVFDRFSQADGTATRRHGGLGLGMAIVRYLVELHGGTVKVESAGENQGATFTIVLPVSLEVEDDVVIAAGESPSSVDTPIEQLPSLDGVTVLVVDDDTDSRNVISQLLQSQGASVVMAGSTSDAFDRFRQVRPDVLVSDIGMPEADGYELIRRVRSLAEDDGGKVPAIALTAYARAEDAAAALSAGYHRHISKPVDVGQLVATVAELVVAATPARAE